MTTRKIATSTLWQVSSQATMAALSILAVKFAAIGLSKELAGNYNSAYGFLQLFGILADFGLYAVAVREVSRAPAQSTVRGKQDTREQVLGVLIVLRVFTLFLSLGTALFFVWILPQWRGNPLPTSVTIASLVPFFTLLAGIIRTVFQVHYKMHFVFVAEVTQRVITVSLIGLLVLYGIRGSEDPQVLYYFLSVGGLGAFILLLISLICGERLMRIRPHYDPALIKKMARAAAPYGVAFLCIALYRQFDITLIALLRPDFELQNAYYGFVLRMTDVGFLIPTFLLNSTLPILSERTTNGEDTRGILGKTFFIILLLGSISFLFSILWSRPLIQLLTTEAYLSTLARPGSDTALRMMSIPLFLNGIVLFSFYVLLTKHAWRRLVVSLLLGGILSLSLNIWLIPSHGFIGAAFTSIIVHTALVVVLLPQSLQVMPMRITREQIVQWITFSVLLAAGLWLLRPLLTHEFNTVIGLGTATALMVVLVFLTRINRSLLR